MTSFKALLVALTLFQTMSYADHPIKALPAPQAGPPEVLCRCSAVLGKTVVKGYDVIGQGAAQGNGCVKWCVTKIKDTKNSFSAGDAERLCEEGKRGELRARAQAGDGPWKEDRTGIQLKNEKGKCLWMIPR